jgi:hypothetical protein
VVRNASASAAKPATGPWASGDDVVHHLGVVNDPGYRCIELRGHPAHEIGRLWKPELSDAAHTGLRDECAHPIGSDKRVVLP